MKIDTNVVGNLKRMFDLEQMRDDEVDAFLAEWGKMVAVCDDRAASREVKLAALDELQLWCDEAAKRIDLRKPT